MTTEMSTDEIRKFVLSALSEMNYSVADVDDDTPLGPAGVDLESLALAELGIRVEEQYGIVFEEDEAETLGTMTVGEFTQALAARITSAPATGQ